MTKNGKFVTIFGMNPYYFGPEGCFFRIIRAWFLLRGIILRVRRGALMAKKKTVQQLESEAKRLEAEIQVEKLRQEKEKLKRAKRK